MSFNNITYNKILNEIGKFSKKDIKIVAISKNQSVLSVNEALDCGVRIFGENKVQEAQSKFVDIKKKFNNLELHLTGPLQTNKVKAAVNLFDVFQTLDREKLAKEFFKFSEALTNKKFFVQVNIGKEETKSGVYPEIAGEFVSYCVNDLKLNVVGLMCIPPIEQPAVDNFKKLKDIAENSNVTELSMGMSSDYLDAIKGGATLIRVGTILFGDRKDVS